MDLLNVNDVSGLKIKIILNLLMYYESLLFLTGLSSIKEYINIILKEFGHRLNCLFFIFKTSNLFSPLIMMFSSSKGINLVRYILAKTIIGVDIKADFRLIVLHKI